MTDSDARRIELDRALTAVRNRLSNAAEMAGRKVEEIELLPITKFFPATDVEILYGLGCRSFGESRDQEAAAKVADLADVLGSPVAWHMVGQVQRNKARSVAAWAHTVHSVSTPRLVTALDTAAGQALAEALRPGPLEVFVQLSLDGDTTRGGVPIDDLAAVDRLCAQIEAAEALRLVGVMGVPPRGGDADAAFARLAAARRRLEQSWSRPLGLSAGMSADLELAVKHGSTCVRVGTAVLGSRPLTSP